ncbi:small G protein signaling modulator 2, partial [Clonorchis sinensis]
MGKYGFSLEPPLQSDKIAHFKAESQTNKTPKSTTPVHQPLYQGLRLAFFFPSLDSEMFLPNWSPFIARRPLGSSEKSKENRPPTSLKQSSTTQSEVDTDHENSGVNLRLSNYKFEERNFRKFRIACGKSKLSKIEECLGRRRDSQPIMENPDSPVDSKEQHETPIEQLCDKIRREILSRAFHRWLGFCRKMRTLRSKLGNLVSPDLVTVDLPRNAHDGITPTLWTHIKKQCEPDFTFHELCRHIYFGSCDESLRREIWPYLLGVYTWGADKDELHNVRSMHRRYYVSTLRQWKTAETLAKKYDANEVDESQQVGSQQTNIPGPVLSKRCVSVCDMVTKPCMRLPSTQSLPSLRFIETCESPGNGGKRRQSVDVEPIQLSMLDQAQTGNGFIGAFAKSENLATPLPNSDRNAAFQLPDDYASGYDDEVGTPTHKDFPKNPIDASSFSPKDLDALSLNLYRIDKDVSRCDRNHSFFATPRRTFDSNPQSLQNPPEYSELNANLYKLRNIICTWVWLHLDTGYIQGMCDLLAPLLIVLEDEALTFACFSALMEWMLPNFPMSIDRSSLDRSPRTSNGNGPTAHTQTKTPTKPTLLSLARRASNLSDAAEISQTLFDSHTRPNTLPVLTAKSTVLTELSSKSASRCSVSLPVVPSPYTHALASRRLNCMDLRFSNLNSLIQVFDSKLHDYFRSKSMDTHLYFCYRWLLLDFKRG